MLHISKLDISSSMCNLSFPDDNPQVNNLNSICYPFDHYFTKTFGKI